MDPPSLDTGEGPPDRRNLHLPTSKFIFDCHGEETTTFFGTEKERTSSRYKYTPHFAFEGLGRTKAKVSTDPLAVTLCKALTSDTFSNSV